MPDLSLELNLLYLLIGPIGEGTADFRITNKVSVAAFAGIGTVDIDVEDPDEPDGLRKHPFTFWDLGGQFRWYVFGAFDHGMILGAELGYIGLSTELDSGGVHYEGVANGVEMGAFAGYKLITDPGLTFEAQLGARWVGLFIDAENSEGATAEDRDSNVSPLIRINAGWSF